MVMQPEKKKMGRPLALTPALMKKRGDAYFKQQDKDKKPYTVRGLIRALKISAEQYYEYETREGFEEIWAEHRNAVWECWEARLFEQGAGGAIFWLKNHAGYRDMRQAEISGPNGTPMQFGRIEIVGVTAAGKKDLDPDAL